MRETLMEKDCWTVIGCAFFQVTYRLTQSDLVYPGISRTPELWGTGKDRQSYLNVSFHPGTDTAWPQFSKGHRMKYDWVSYLLRWLWVVSKVLSWIIFHHHWSIVSTLVIRPSDNNSGELKWKYVTRPEAIRRAERAPVGGQGLGLTTWHAWVWWVIRCYHVETH